MDGKKRCGAVSGLTTVVNAISLARLVMEKTPHIYLAFDGAEAFAREQVRISTPFLCTQIDALRFMTVLFVHQFLICSIFLKLSREWRPLIQATLSPHRTLKG